jgi:hypothetical protein
VRKSEPQQEKGRIIQQEKGRKLNRRKGENG